MMAGNSTPSAACQGLLQKLKKGQDVLRRSIENINPPAELANVSRKNLSQRKFQRRCRDSLTVDLTRISNFPKKRARSEQLTPEYETSPTKPLSKHPRRLSSTPLKTSSNHPPESGHSPSTAPEPHVDLSLEEALFDRTSRENISKSVDDYSLPSPKLSRIVVDTGRNITSNSVKPALLFSRTSAQKNKKKRGLTVSFVQNDSDKSTCKPGSPDSTSRKKFTRHATQRNLDTSLVDSLNSSRYGAMERHYNQTRKEGRFPGKSLGTDPRLGYDWIAGLLDASESYLSERDNEYFEEMKEFRRVNFDECHRPKEVVFPTSSENIQDQTAVEDPQETTCVRSYVLNDRLFPMHVSSVSHAPGTACPACEDKPAKLASSNRYVRVSVPHSILQPPSKFRPHRRRSFDPTDSMGLAKHCMAGWETAKPSMVPPQPSIDLKSSLTKDKHQSEMSLGLESESGSGRGCNLLDTSHTIEYNIRSRATKSMDS